MTKLIDRQLLQDLGGRAATSPRLRAHHNLHPQLDDPVQRLCVALQPGTYVRPHRHGAQWEMLVCLAGRLAVLEFDDGGRVLARYELGPEAAGYGVELAPGTWHSVVALAADSLMLEVKQGPYRATPAQDFAAWAPAEGEAGAASMVAWMTRAQAGEGRFTTTA